MHKKLCTFVILAVGCQVDSPISPLLKPPGLTLSNEIRVFLCQATDIINEMG